MPVNLFSRMVAIVTERTALLSTRRECSIEPCSEHWGLRMSSSILLLNVALESEDCSTIRHMVVAADSC